MDPITQGALGAAWAQPAANGSRIRSATIVGCLSAMTPDLDLFIRSGRDPLLAIEFHRHFTHSLVFIPLGALICAALLYPFFKRDLSFPNCYGFSLLGFASHGILDAFTSYGTLLFWPFSDQRIAWDLISVVDPLFTIPLIVLVWLGARRRRREFGLVALAWCVCYLSFGYLQHQRAKGAAFELAASRGHAPAVVETKPSFANLFLWKTVYLHEERYYVDAVRVALGTTEYAGETRLALNLKRDFPWLEPASAQARDIERFRRFADDYLAVDSANPNLIVDLRYSLVPNRGSGLWGIELDAGASTEAHASYVTMRNRSFAEGRELLRMLFR
jgi:inner membrane protein